MTRALALALTSIMILATWVVPGIAQTATSPYKLTVFAGPPASTTGLSAPDSLAVWQDHVFVGYGDGHAPDGSDGLSSQIVEYDAGGSIVNIYTVKGHNDGLKLDPFTQKLWALQNEDANPHLVIIDPATGHQSTPYPFTATPHGGGYDDMVFRCGAKGKEIYISASNPANNPNGGPAIVRASLIGHTVAVEPALLGNASATDIPTDTQITLNLQDPDSMTLDPQGNVVLDSQADQELIIVSAIGTPLQQALRLPLSYQALPVETDDTAFVTSPTGTILFADKGLNTVYALKRTAFVPGTVFTAADGGPIVGTLDLTTGIVTPVVTGLNGPGGLIFVDAHPQPIDAEHGQCNQQGD